MPRRLGKFRTRATRTGDASVDPPITGTKPGAPTGLAVTQSGSDATVTWNPPTVLGTDPIVGWKAARDGLDAGGGGAYVTPNALPLSPRTFTFSYLRPGDTYNLSIFSVLQSGAEGPAAVIPVKMAGSYIPPRPEGSAGQMAAQADAFVDSISITMHFNYVSQDEVRNSHWPAFRDMRARHWRDGGPNDANWREKVRIMCQNGARGTVTIDPRDGNNPDTVVQYLKDCFRDAGAHSIERIEGGNEHDINGTIAWNGNILWTDGGDTTWERHFQRLMYERVKADPATRHVIVCGPSIAHPDPGDWELGRVDCDEINGHWYQGGAVPDDQWPTGTGTHPFGAWSTKWALDDRQNPGAPVFISETGYHLDFERAGQPGISQNAACKYIPRIYLEAWWRSVLFGRPIRASVYNLSHDGWSCMLRDGIRHPSYYALQALIRLLEDPGTSFTPTPFDGTINASSSGDLKWFVLTRRDGRRDIVAWRNARSVIQGERRDISVARVAFSVTTPTARTGVVYRPSTGYTVNNGISQAFAQETTSGTTHAIQVGDEPTILRLSS